jgi:hypothetical protein
MQVPLASLYDAGKGPGVWRISAAGKGHLDAGEGAERG